MIRSFYLENKSLVEVESPAQRKKKPVWIDVEGEDVRSALEELQSQCQIHPTLKEHVSVDPGNLKQFLKHNTKNWTYSEEKCLGFKLILMNPQSLHKFEILVVLLTKDSVITLRESSHSFFQEIKTCQFSHRVSFFHELFSSILNANAGYLDEYMAHMDHMSWELFHTKDETMPIDNGFLQRMTMRIGRASHFVIRMLRSFDSVENCLDYLIHDESSKIILGTYFKAFKIQAVDLLEEVVVQQRVAQSILSGLTYLSDVSLGIVGVNQNETTRFLSVLATVLIPPSLVVGFFQMADFKGAPEIAWPIGFFAALISSMLSSYLFYLWFKNRKID